MAITLRCASRCCVSMCERDCLAHYHSESDSWSVLCVNDACFAISERDHHNAWLARATGSYCSWIRGTTAGTGSSGPSLRSAARSTCPPCQKIRIADILDRWQDQWPGKQESLSYYHLCRRGIRCRYLCNRLMHEATQRKKECFSGSWSGGSIPISGIHQLSALVKSLSYWAPQSPL